MFGDVPSPRFARKHAGKLVYLPRRRPASGDVAPQEYQIRCPCGWESHPSSSQTVISGEQQDHIFQEWLKAKGKK